MFGRRETKDPSKVLRLHGEQWRQGDGLRITPRRRWNTDPDAKRMVIRRRDVGEFALTRTFKKHGAHTAKAEAK